MALSRKTARVLRLLHEAKEALLVLYVVEEVATVDEVLVLIDKAIAELERR